METSYEHLIETFHLVPETESKLDVVKVNKFAISRGYLIHPDACNYRIMNFLINKPEISSFNMTFYTAFKDVTSKKRFELLIDQLLHYCTTYGTDFQMNNGYVPNQTDITEELNDDLYNNIISSGDVDKLIIINACTEKEMYDKCLDVVYSNIARKSEVIESICDYIISHRDQYGEFNIDNVKNREALVVFCKKLNIYPTSPIDILRYIIYVQSGSSLLIKDRNTIFKLKHSSKLGIDSFDMNVFNEEQLKSLSSIFYRFKPLFLALKSKRNAKIINKIRRYAVKYHKPMDTPFLNNLIHRFEINDAPDFIELRENLKDATNFKLIQLMQSVRKRLLIVNEFINKPDESTYEMYRIRNGKMFTKKITTEKDQISTSLGVLYNMLRDQLINNLKSKACKVKYPASYELTCPTSEKNFMGDLPIGTKYNMDGSNFVGIYWRNEWGARDFDLSYITESGQKIGWDNIFYINDQKLIFSGDMTNADPEAAEVLYIENDAPDGIVKVNQYNGSNDSKFILNFARTDEDIQSLNKNYMINPNWIEMSTEINTETSREKVVGMIYDKVFYINNLSCGYAITSNGNNAKDVFKSLAIELQSTLNLRDILSLAGFEEVKEDEKPDIDFTHISRGDLIELFS